MHSPFGKVVDEVWTCVMPPLRSLATDANPTKQWKAGRGSDSESSQIQVPLIRGHKT
jgi:hypothetical protein